MLIKIADFAPDARRGDSETAELTLVVNEHVELALATPQRDKRRILNMPGWAIGHCLVQPGRPHRHQRPLRAHRPTECPAGDDRQHRRHRLALGPGPLGQRLRQRDLVRQRLPAPAPGTVPGYRGRQGLQHVPGLQSGHRALYPE